MYTLRTLDGDDVFIRTEHIVRIYRMKNKVSLADGAVLRVGTAELDRLLAAMEMREGVEAY